MDLYLYSLYMPSRRGQDQRHLYIITLLLHVCGVGGGGPIYMQLTLTFVFNFRAFRTKVGARGDAVG